MANIRRWDPFNEMLSLRDAVSQLFEESYVNPARGSNTSTLALPLDVSETQDAFVVDAVVPGLTPEDLDITIQDNVLTIRGETRKQQSSNDKQTNVHVVERRYGRFSRSLGLPTPVQADQVQATLEHGVLHLEIPKAEQIKPRKITVNSGSAANSQPIDVTDTHEQSNAVGQ